ncbi:YceH family protein [Rubricoccus marinus]|uniref:Uncharacterized protein n=1 Tax=Rubricoccus marinus TaxID=716817 RepID=A0A259TYS5_9BACT|nr:YceH family protein [Rubricoccus marinus]OZC02899.1 hypothetical protein BSZ36_07885 [Rubricoccus marinus]
MPIPTLDAIETRVLGALIEKSLATPDSYPLTTNALIAACNQRSSRDPVMDVTEREVSGAVERVKRRKLAGVASGAGHRVSKLRHSMDIALGLSRRELAVLAVLMLRGPQTPGEIRTRVGRMAEMTSVDEAEEALWMLSERDEPLVAKLPRQPGQSAERYTHTLLGDVAPLAPEAEGDAAEPVSTLAERVATLEALVETLQGDLAALKEALGAD